MTFAFSNNFHFEGGEYGNAVLSRFPIATQAPGRAFYWVTDRDPALARKLAQVLYRGYFAEDRDISSPETTADIARSAANRGAAKSSALPRAATCTATNKNPSPAGQQN